LQDGVCNPVRNVYLFQGGWLLNQPIIQLNVTDGVANPVQRRTLRTGLQTPSSGERYGRGCKPRPAANVTDGVANPVQRQTLRTGLQTPSSGERYGRGCKPRPAANVTDGVANPVQRRLCIFKAMSLASSKINFGLLSSVIQGRVANNALNS
jgi:hypothetical protein